MHIASQEGHSGVTHVQDLLLSYHLGEREDRLRNILFDSLHLLSWELLAIDPESQLQPHYFLQCCLLWVGDLISGDLSLDFIEILPLLLSLWVDLFSIFSVSWFLLFGSQYGELVILFLFLF